MTDVSGYLPCKIYLCKINYPPYYLPLHPSNLPHFLLPSIFLPLPFFSKLLLFFLFHSLPFSPLFFLPSYHLLLPEAVGSFLEAASARVGPRLQLHRELYKLSVKSSVFGIHYLSSVEMG